VAAVVLGLQALASLAFGVGALVQTPPAGAVDLAGVGVFMLGYGAGLAATGLGVSRSRRWARAPGVATQLIHLPVAWGFRMGATTEIALALALSAATVLVVLLLPSSTRAFVGDPSEDDPSVG
jgi:hypothetical protein